MRRQRRQHRPIRYLTLLGVWLLLGSSTPPALPGTEASPAAPSGPTIVTADDRHIVLEWPAPGYDLSQISVDGRRFDQVSLSGCPPAGQPGDPQVPACTVLLGVPPDASLGLEIIEEETAPIPGTYHLLPVPRPIIQEDPLAEGPAALQFGGEEWEEGPAYAGGVLFPQRAAALGQPAFLRHQRIVPVTFYPVQFHPASGELTYHPRLRLKVTLAEAQEAAGFVAESPAFERLLADLLLNYSQAQNWRRTSSTALALLPVPPDPGYRIPVRQAGIYSLTYAVLAAAGLPVDTLDPRTLRLFRYGQEVAVRVRGEEDGRFDAGDTLLFYGRPIRGDRYTDTEVYWLTYGGVPGRRMAERDGTPQGSAPVPQWFATVEHREENHQYFFQMPWRPDHDHWFWNYIYTTAPGKGTWQQTYTFPAHALAGGPYTATLRLYLYGASQNPLVNPDHHLRIFVNGTQVGDLWWDGQQELTPTLEFPSSLLQPSGNGVRIEAPLDNWPPVTITSPVELDIFDWLELGQRRLFAAEQDRLEWNGEPGRYEYHVAGFSEQGIALFDVTDPDNPTQISGTAVISTNPSYELRFEDVAPGMTAYLATTEGRFLQPESITRSQPADLRDPANGADYLIISPGSFMVQAQTLAALRASQGLRSRAVDVQDVYDLFAYGRRGPAAIHDFLAYTFENWTSPAPSYVALLGDGHYDPKNYLGYGTGYFVPPYLGFVDPWIGETAADNRYVCLSGSDTVPDMHLGRLPANTPAQAQTMVDKIVNYERTPPPGDWRRQSLFVADNADEAGDFASMSDGLISGYYPAPYQAGRVYLGIAPHQTPTQARSAIIASINAGRLLVNYIGHGGPGLWAAESLLNNNSINSLSNGPYYPVALPMTCYEGYYINPNSNPVFSALSETFLRAQGKGWVATWSPTGLGVATGHHFLNEGFLRAVFYDDENQIGPATMAGKLRLYASGASLELLDTYLLLGDPALAIPILTTDLSLQKTAEPSTPLRPGDPLTFTLSLANAGPATAHHIVLADLLPAWLVSSTITAQGVVLTQRPGPNYAWDVSDMAGSQAGSVTIAGRVSISAPPGFSANLATISTSALETDPHNNLDWATLLIAAGPPAQISATVHPPSLPADGVSLALIRAQVRDQAGNPVADGTPVYFYTDAGTFLEGGSTFTANTSLGTAEALLRSGSEVFTATVSLAAGAAWRQVPVPLLPLIPYSVTLSAVPATIPLTGTSQITATVEDMLGHPVADGTRVTFTSSLGSVTPTLAATQSGRATAALRGGGQAGLAGVIARSGSVAGATSVRIGPGAGLTVTLEITPTQLPADGASWATVTATLRNGAGQLLTGTHWVTFTTTLGQIPSRSLAVSGTAAVSLTAATRAGQAVVMASAEGASAWVTVHLLPGSPARLTLTAAPPTIPVDGHRALLTAVVEDVWGNPVVDGTPLTLTTTLGSITPTAGTTWAGRLQSLLTSGTQAGTATATTCAGPLTTTAQVDFLPLAPYTLTLSANPPVLLADGTSTTTLSIGASDRFGNPVADGTTVRVLTTMGLVQPAQVPTTQGRATATLRASTEVGTALVQALAGEARTQLGVPFVPGPPHTVLLTVDPTVLSSSWASAAGIRVHVLDALGRPVVDGTVVTLTTSLGEVTPQFAPTLDGRIEAILWAGRIPGQAIVRAESGEAWSEVSVSILCHIPLPLILAGSP